MRLRSSARFAIPVAASLATLVIAAGSVLAHGPDPSLGGTLWAQDQALTYGWRSGQVPPSWMTPAIDAAAADASITRSARAATFTRSSGTVASVIAYGEPTGCSAAGIACFDRSGAPTSFRMWFRAHGYVYDWGKLLWCQGLTTIANGCFDAENVALDEFGHVDVLNHHLNLADGSDYLDAVVQTVARARPSAGWNSHALGRCDTARLQLEYDRLSPASYFSGCLAIATTTSLGASAASVASGTIVRFSASLRTSSSTANQALASDPVSARSVTLQRRTSSTAAWSAVGAMASSTVTAGSYTLSVTLSATYEWRAVFTPGAGDGALGSASAVVKVTVSP